MALCFLHQQVVVVGSDHIVEHAQTEPLLGFENQRGCVRSNLLNGWNYWNLWTSGTAGTARRNGLNVLNAAPCPERRSGVEGKLWNHCNVWNNWNSLRRMPLMLTYVVKSRTCLGSTRSWQVPFSASLSAFSRRSKPTIIIRRVVYYWTVIPCPLAYVKLTNGMT